MWNSTFYESLNLLLKNKKNGCPTNQPICCCLKTSCRTVLDHLRRGGLDVLIRWAGSPVRRASACVTWETTYRQRLFGICLQAGFGAKPSGRAIAFVSRFFFPTQKQFRLNSKIFKNMSHTCRHFLRSWERKFNQMMGVRAVMATGHHDDD